MSTVEEHSPPEMSGDMSDAAAPYVPAEPGKRGSQRMYEAEGATSVLHTSHLIADGPGLSSIVIEGCDTRGRVGIPCEEEGRARVCCSGACQQGHYHSGDHDDGDDLD